MPTCRALWSVGGANASPAKLCECARGATKRNGLSSLSLVKKRRLFIRSSRTRTRVRKLDGSAKVCFTVTLIRQRSSEEYVTPSCCSDTAALLARQPPDHESSSTLVQL